jgi:hypothetical protein
MTIQTARKLDVANKAVAFQRLISRHASAQIGFESGARESHMRKSLLGVSVSIAFTACGQPTTPAPTEATVPPTEQTQASVAKPHASVEGWETDITAYASMGSTLPAFALKQADGTELTQENLRDRWTILGFVGASDAVAKREHDYIAALNSAADQDPDLDFLAVQAAIGAPAPWPTVYDDAGVVAALHIDTTPTYLLVGPDLTIEGYRGALASTPDDGIKSVIRGVAEIRKQVAAPE